MISSAFKKLAKENGMQVGNGVAYGSLRGYAATLEDGSGTKTISFATSLKDPEKLMQLKNVITQYGDRQLNKDFRVAQIGIDNRFIRVVFNDTFGTMKRIYAFLDWFIPLLQQYEATPANVCSECGLQVDDPCWIMLDDMCFPVHAACADSMERQIDQENEQLKQEQTGSYLRGAIGAALGAALGAVVWAIVLLMGYLASIVGLLIGWLAKKGYDLLKGKQGKGKVLILILAVIVGVVLGTLAADAFAIAKMITDGELLDYTYGDIPRLIGILFEDPVYVSTTAKNVVMGLLFAGLGVFVMLRNTGREVSGTKMKRMK